MLISDLNKNPADACFCIPGRISKIPLPSQEKQKHTQLQHGLDYITLPSTLFAWTGCF